jgi:hypothetical protein
MGAIDRFVEATREIFANTPDARSQAHEIAGQMKTLLAAPGLLEEIEQKGGGKPGRINLHIDEEYGHPRPGFCLMTSLTPRGKKTGGARAHDHGASFVVYGVYKGAIEQTKYVWGYNENRDLTAPELKQGDQFVQNVGDVAFFLPGEIHRTSAVGDEPPIVIRMEAQLLDNVTRHSYNLDGSRAVVHS